MPETEDDVELPVLLDAQLADVPLPEVDGELEHARREARLLETGRAALDADDLGTAPSELDRVHALEAGEVEDPRACQVAVQDVGDDLRDPAQLDLVAAQGRRDRVHAIREPHVVGRPGPMALDDFVASALDLVPVHGAMLPTRQFIASSACGSQSRTTAFRVIPSSGPSQSAPL